MKKILVFFFSLFSSYIAVADNNSLFNGYYIGGGLGYSHGKVVEENSDWLEGGTDRFLLSGKNSNFNHMLFNINGGYNLQLNNKSIIGFEIDNSTVNQTANGDLINYDHTQDMQTHKVISKTSIHNIQTLRLKYGLEQNNIYYYITGGLALTEVKRQVTALDFDGVNRPAYLDAGTNIQKTSFESGYALGAGMEMPIKDNLTFSLKYMYTDFGSIKYTYNGFVNTLDQNNNPITFSELGNQKIKLDNSMLTIGLNYHF
jgi:opacity protein-like surface antigen